jgi:hypothetical protein
MRRTILLSLFALLAVSAANDTCAQRRGGAGRGFARGGYGFSRARAVSPYGFGYAYLPYDSGAAYAYAPQPALFVSSHPRSFSRLRRPSSSRRGILWSQTTNGPQQARLLPPPHSRHPPSPSHGSLPLSSRTVRPSPP